MEKIKIFGELYNCENWIESNIITSSENKDILKNLIFPDKSINSKLLYRLSKNGSTISNFHNLCDNIGPNLSIIKIRKNSNTSSYNRFGGFTSLNWECSKKIKTDETAFIFSLTKKKMFRAKYPYTSIFCSKNYGPSFGYDGSYSGFWTKEKYGGYNPCETFGDKDRECTCGLKDFTIDEIEVFQIENK